MKHPTLKLSLCLLLLAAAMPRDARAQIFSVRANVLAATTATLNVGAEVAVADKWSVEVSAYWNPLHTSNLSARFRALQAGSRYWLYESFVGHFIGQHITYVSYDVGNATYRYKGHAYGIGISYGYAWMLSTRWNITAEAGIGLYRTRDVRRDVAASDWQTEYRYHNRRWTLAPSKLEISFNYIF